MIAIALMLLQAAPTFNDVVNLPPKAAGDLALAGKQHLTIESVKTSGIATAPGVMEAQLIERPMPLEAGCARRRWTVTFYAKADTDPNGGTIHSASSTTEIALSK